ncbi:MAG: lytic transglycosylase domain-containing protein [Desulfobacterales bacterium]|nr:MAG: lytic transglycosylase domain-containing protein [Desulfobacterales bacterium]
MGRRNGTQRLLVWLSCGALIVLASVLTAKADIYRYIDEEGVMHFTNVPTSSAYEYQVFIHERPKADDTYTSDKFDHLISNASKDFGVAFPLLKAIIKAESNFNPRAVSKKGAKGLMQIMPQNFELLDIEDPYDPSQNIMAGARYFKQLYDRFNGKLALTLAAYNAGPDAVERYQDIPPFQETENYVKKVLEYYQKFKNL